MKTSTALAVIEYGVTELDIAAAREKYSALSADTPKGYEEVRVAIAELRGTRVKIENRRVELKADALEFGRKVDATAKTLTALIVEIEEPLKSKKAAVDDEKERVKREAEEAEKRALEAKVRAERVAEEAKLRAAREVEDARLKADAERLAAERAAYEEQKRKDEEAQAAERARVEERLAAERAAQRAAQAKIDAERAEVEKRARAVAEQEAAARRAEEKRQADLQAERERAEAHERALAAAKREAELLAAMAPEIERVHTFGAEIRAFAVGHAKLETFASQDCGRVVMEAFERLGQIADDLEHFEVKRS